MTVLTEEQITAELANLPGWERQGSKITKSFKFPSFPVAMEFVNDLAKLAEAQEHHPDIMISYDTVTLTLTTFDEGEKLTDYDFASAHSADEIFQRFSSKT